MGKPPDEELQFRRRQDNPACPSDRIVRGSRQSSSGTFQYFREAILGKGQDFALGTMDLNGSKEVIDLVARTPCAIAYTGMGYVTKDVKALCISRGGQPCVRPLPETALNRSYPIARELYMLTLGKPSGDVAEYLAWIRGREAQELVREKGFVAVDESGYAL